MLGHDDAAGVELLQNAQAFCFELRDADSPVLQHAVSVAF